jgi:hypothetical protein
MAEVPSMRKATSFILFAFSAAFALLCIPLLFLAGRGIIPINEEFFYGSLFLASIICFISGLVYLVRYRQDNTYQRLIALVGVFISGTWVLIVGCLIAAVVLLPSYDDYTHNIPFDQNKWQSQADNNDIFWPARLCMAGDLVDSGRLDGLSREQVSALLGAPSDSPDGKTAARLDVQAGPNDICYYLGPERGYFRVDSEWLVILFDKNDKVKAYRIRTD